MTRPELQDAIRDLSSPDPAVRDEGAFADLATMLDRGDLEVGELRWLGGQLADGLSAPQVWTRSFSALVLGVLATHWPQDEPWPQTWSDQLLQWYPQEADLRGYDADLGWLHAVAHGADALGALGSRGFVPPETLLGAAATRLTNPTQTVWHDMEDDRLAAAVCAILQAHPQTDLDALLPPVAALFATGEPGPMPAHVDNCVHTLRSLYVALGNEILGADGQSAVRLPNADRLQRAIAATLQPVTAWWWRISSC